MPSETVVPPQKPMRDQRVDFYRGIALAMIFVNHVPGNIWENYTSRNFGFSDSAELFVFLAGFASAFAYAKPFLGGARLVTLLKAWRRAGVLYLVHIMLTMFAIGLFCWAALAFGRGDMLLHFGLETFITRPIEALVGVITLSHQLGYVNILPMYSVILLMLPVHLLLVKLVGRHGMLLAAALFWLVTGLYRLDIPNFPYPGGWFFNPLAWQFIFAIGLWCGLSKWQRSLPAVPYNGTLYTLAIAYLIGAYVFVGLDAWGSERLLGWPFLISYFDKTFVTLPRLLHLLAMIYVFAHAPLSSPLQRVGANNPFTLLGRHSLPVFALGTALSLIAQIVHFGRPSSFLYDSALIGVGLALHFALAAYLDWWKRTKPAPKAAPRPVVATPAAGTVSPKRGEAFAPTSTA